VIGRVRICRMNEEIRIGCDHAATWLETAFP